MKKTLTVNLGGTVYHIDEDAYILLDNYLNNLRYHFRKSQGAEEIVHDMEIRIAELFDEYIQEGKQVITIEQVEAVIARMGKPEELNDDFEKEEDAPKTDSAQGQQTTRRIFRNPDDRILGGVVSGLAACGLHCSRNCISRTHPLLPHCMDCISCSTYRYRKITNARRTH